MAFAKSFVLDGIETHVAVEGGMKMNPARIERYLDLIGSDLVAGEQIRLAEAIIDSFRDDTPQIVYIDERSRRTIEKIADAVTTLQRETVTALEQGEAVTKECTPLFESLGMSNDGDGWGFDEGLFSDS